MLQRIRCGECGWVSDELDQEARMRRNGVPWYCDRCGERVYHFINYEPHERAEVAERWQLDA
jgi:hypothetical protein